MGDATDDPGLVGRAAELAALQLLVTAAAAGAGGFAVVEGEAGIGKSALLGALATDARAHGALVRRGRAWEEGGAPPYWPWVEMAADGGWDVDWSSHGDRFALYQAVAEVLRADARAHDGPTLLLLDDLHAADDDTRRLTRFVARAVAREPVVLVVATRPGPHVAELARLGEHVALAPLADADVDTLLAARGGERLDPSARAAIRARAEGNPLFVAELARSTTTGRPVSPGLLPIVAPSLADLPPAAADVAAAAAVIGRSFPLPLLAAATGRPLADVLAALEPLRRAGVVTVEGRPPVGSFSHQLVRDVVYDGIALPRRLARHAAVADAIAAEPGAGREAERAHHLAAAVPLVDPTVAADACRHAAATARARTAHADASSLLRQAVALTSDESERLDTLVALGAAQRAAGQVGAATATFDDAIALGRERRDGRRVAVAVLGRTELAAWGRPAVELVALVDEALAGVDDDDLAVRLRVRRAGLAAMGDDVESARRDAREALAAARALGPGHERVVADALATVHRCCWGPEHLSESLHVGTELVEVATALGDTERLAEALLARLIDHLRAGDVRGADDALRRYAALAARTGDPRHRFFLDSRRAMRAFMDGRLDEGALLLARADETAQQIEEPDALQVFHGAQMVVADELRSADELLAAARMAEGLALAGEPRLNLHAAHTFLRAGDLDGARVALRRLRRELPALTLAHLPLFDLCLTAEVAVACDEQTMAAELWDALERGRGFAVVNAGAVTFGGVVDEYLADLAGTLGRPGREVMLRAALDRYETMGATWFEARVRRKLDALTATGASTTLPSPAPEAHRAALVRLDGGHWELAFDGRRTVLADARGLHHLHRLLAAPGREIAAAELVAGPEARAMAAHEARDAVLDDRAKAAYRRRVGELQAELDDADTSADVERSERARAELDLLLDELRRAVGLGGRDRSGGTTAERARVTARKAIATAMDRIAEHEPELARLLRATIRTGLYCAYEPQPLSPVTWELERPG